MAALLFDCDGVLADTERFGHLPAFNRTFTEFGLPLQWSEDDYAEKLKIGGGKERMKGILTPAFVAAAHLPTDDDGQRDLLATWHKRKTAIYTELVESGALPGRPGIARITRAALAAGFDVAVASTSAEVSVRAVLTHAVGAELAEAFHVFAGDVVPRKKPAPDIYLLALHDMGLHAADVIVVEDSANGLRASHAAGLRTIVTVSSYTAAEDFTGASLVVSSLGEPPQLGGPSAIVLAKASTTPALASTFVDVGDLLAIIAAPLPSGQIDSV